jgi:DNA-binding CsgD family transcriptional regulator
LGGKYEDATEIVGEKHAIPMRIATVIKLTPLGQSVAVQKEKPCFGRLNSSDSCCDETKPFRAGASGIFSRDQSSDLLCKCIHAVHKGQVWANSKELRFVIEALGPALPAKSICTRGSDLLTKREVGVVDLVAAGLTNRDISLQLHLSEHTVRNYLFRIFNKVGTSNRLELALYAIHRREGHDQQISLAAKNEPHVVLN